MQPPAQALDELAAVVSDVERDDDEVVVIYLLGSILNRATNEIILPINVTAANNYFSYCIIIFHRTSLVWGPALLKTARIME